MPMLVCQNTAYKFKQEATHGAHAIQKNSRLPALHRFDNDGVPIFSTPHAGTVNAGFSQEERATKAEYAPAVNTAYAAAQQADYAGKPISSHTRVGGFMARILEMGFYSQNSSALCPYDGDIGQIKLENCKIEGRTGRKPETPRACELAGKREKSVFQGKSGKVSVIWL